MQSENGKPETTPDYVDYYDEDHADADEDFEDEWDNCGLGDDGQCSLAGSEHCDFSCANRDSELFAGSRAWCKKHKVKYRG